MPMNNTNNESFDVLKRLTELRKLRGMTVYKLAKLAGIPQSTIATWYQKNLYPPINKLERLCAVLDVSLSDFFKTKEDESLIERDNHDLLIKWYLLTDEQRSVVNDLLDLLCEKNQSSESDIISLLEKSESESFAPTN